MTTKHLNHPKNKLKAQPGVPVAFSIYFFVLKVREKKTEKSEWHRDPRQVKIKYEDGIIG